MINFLVCFWGALALAFLYGIVVLFRVFREEEKRNGGY